jgi:serine/threonine protein kinase
MENTGKQPWLSVSTGFEGLGRAVNLGDLEKVKSLGKGAYGMVLKVRSVKTGTLYALKIISKMLIENLKMIDQLKNEISIMQKLEHPNIVKLLTHFEDEKNIYFILDLAEDQHLYSRLGQVGKYDEPTAAKYMFDIFKAVNYLHTQNPPIIHRDIKPENILFSATGLKLADFGWSNMKDGRVRTTYCGTPDYLAPEMVLEKGHNEKLDVWTLGVLLYELVVGRAPFSPNPAIKDKRMAEKELRKNIMECKLKFPPEVSSVCKEIIKKLLQKEPKNRPSCEEALRDPFFKNNGFIWEMKGAKQKEDTSSSTLTKSNQNLDEMKLTSSEISNKTKKDPTKKIDSSLLNSKTGSIVIPESLSQLPSELKNRLKEDPIAVVEEIFKAYKDKKRYADDLQKAMELKNQENRDLIEKQKNLVDRATVPKKLVDNEEREYTIESIQEMQKKIADLKEEKNKAGELETSLDEKSREMELIKNHLKEINKTLAGVQEEKEEINLEKERLAQRVREIEGSQKELEEEWRTEKELILKNAKKVEDILKKNPETRPEVIQVSLLKVIDVLEEISRHYMSKTKNREESSKEDTTLSESIAVKSLTSERDILQKKLLSLEGEYEMKLQFQIELKENEYQTRYAQMLEESVAEKDQEIAKYEKKLEDHLALISENSSLREQNYILKQKVEDKERVNQERSLQTEKAFQSISISELESQNLREMIFKLKTEIENLKRQTSGK